MSVDFYVNIIPWLKYVPTWFPGAGWKRNVHAWRVDKEEMLNKPYEWTKAQMVCPDFRPTICLQVNFFKATGTAPPSILKDLLTTLATNEPPSHGLEKEEETIRWTINALFVGMFSICIDAKCNMTELM